MLHEASRERVLTSHTGSLPRPDDLVELLYRRQGGELSDMDSFRARAGAAVCDVVQTQVQHGVDIVNDGEVGKVGYATYITERLTGFEGESKPRPVPLEWQEFPEFYGRRAAEPAVRTPACSAPLCWKGDAEIAYDIRALSAAVEAEQPAGAFMTSISPGGIWYILPNEYYPTDEAYVFAAAEAMRPEYEAIVAGGFLLQLDCPDLAGGRNRPQYAHDSIDKFRRMVTIHIEALNHAVANIPPDRMRMHVCWGNYEGPHLSDVPLEDIIDLLYQSRPAGLVLEAANPRHTHEWMVFEDHPLPDDKVLVTGVLDSTTNFVEHPELVAQRLTRMARVIGKERVIAGTDCGFATFAARRVVEPRIAWLKFDAMVEGARIASQRLWNQAQRV
jgi:5-methyltetrahydropteroyltriglutamate--homocysteine methyltransferase